MMMITGDGESASTVSSQESARKCFDAYASTNGLRKLSETSRDDFCSESFFQKFAYHLTSIHRTKQNTLLMRGTVLSYIGCIMIIGQNQMFRGKYFYINYINREPNISTNKPNSRYNDFTLRRSLL
jgi:hypothetical protein